MVSGSWREHNGNIHKIVEVIRKEVRFQAQSYWDDSTGYSGRYLWGYATRAPGPGVNITPDHAMADLISAVRSAAEEYDDVFEFCPSEINEVRGHALIRLLHYLGHVRFMRMTDFIAAIFRGEWSEAGYQLRNTVWYELNGRKARCIMHEIRDGVVFTDYQEEE